MFFVCKRRWDEMEVRRADERTRRQSRHLRAPCGACQERGFLCQADMRYAWAWRGTAIFLFRQPQQVDGFCGRLARVRSRSSNSSSSRNRSRRSCGPFAYVGCCSCRLGMEIVPKDNPPLRQSPARPQLQLMAGSRLQSVVHLNRGHQVQLMARPAGYLQTSFTFRLSPFQPMQTIQI